MARRSRDHRLRTTTHSHAPHLPRPLYRAPPPPRALHCQKNWLNDPNGLVYFAGEYHLFFQHNPNGIEWGDMTWGHAVSKDLVRWTQLDNAITPDALGTIYSGSAAVDWLNTTSFRDESKSASPPLVAMYTAAGGQSPESKGKPFTQCLAFSNDNGRTWTKFAGNPVIPHIAAENRDPKIIWYPPTKRWIVALYEDGSRFSLHESPDLKHWTKLQDLEMPGCSECPDFFPLPLNGDKTQMRWVFTAADARYLVGTFDGRMFKPEGGVKQTDFGRNFYAVQSYSDLSTDQKGRTQIAWMRGPRRKDMPFNQQMSFPTRVTLKSTPDGPRLFRNPVSQLQTLHDGNPQAITAYSKSDVPTVNGSLIEFNAEAYHIQATIEPGSLEEVGLEVFGQPIRYTVADKTLHALGDVKVELENDKLILEIIADRGSIETFAQNGRYALASCFDPNTSGEKPRPIAVVIKGKEENDPDQPKGRAVMTLLVTPLKSMWERRR
ncbi:MAG: glycoside hydrolase family 32 protein [Phycisphaerales bacterium]